MDPFRLLGLAPGADEVAIKRAYAERLRRTRPDDDPVGFQRLNEAFQAALARTRGGQARTRRRGPAWRQPIPVSVNVQAAGNRPAAGPAPSGRDVPHGTLEPDARPAPIEPRDAPRPKEPAFRPDQFIAQFRERCAARDTSALARWLAQHPAFWNIPTKHAAGQMLLRALFERPAHMSEECFAATSDFFHFDDALSGPDPMLLQRVRERSTVAWLVQQGNCKELARRIFGSPLPANTHIVRSAIRITSRPFRWWRVLPHVFRMNRFMERMGMILTFLCGGNLADLPPQLDRDHARFWIDAAHPGPSRARLLVYGLRTAVLLILVPLATAQAPAFVAMDAGTAIAWKGVAQIGAITLGVASAVAAAVWLLVGMGWLSRMLEARSAKSRGLRIVLLSGTPSLCGAAFVVGWATDPLLGLVVALAALAIALWRATRHATHKRTSTQRAIQVAIWIGAIGFLNALGSSLVPASVSSQGTAMLLTTMFVLIALATWAWDWNKRGFLAPRG